MQSMNAHQRFVSGPKKILIVLHQENSTPARVGRYLSDMGYELDKRWPRYGDSLPETMEEHAGAVIFGGPQSANDPDDYVKQEIDWIGVPLKEDKPVLGICLGAQMMARHLGERVYIHDDRVAEIGYYPLAPTQMAADIASEPFPSMVYQWHKEGFDLPRAGTLLAEGCDLFPVQAFQYGSATGLQFHPEVTYAMIWRWTTRGHDRMRVPHARDREEHLANWFLYDPPVAAWLRSFLTRWVGGKVGASA